MTIRFAIAGATALILSAVTTGAQAGYWNYGCKGAFGETALLFDRFTFLIMPKRLASGDIAGLVKSEIYSFDADDNNSGFLPVMKFARGAYPDQKIVLTEKSSRQISKQTGHVGTREKSTVTSRKIYHYQRLGWTDAPEGDVVMDCIEYMLSAP
jgi:hypothetical protein